MSVHAIKIAQFYIMKMLSNISLHALNCHLKPSDLNTFRLFGLNCLLSIHFFNLLWTIRPISLTIRANIANLSIFYLMNKVIVTPRRFILSILNKTYNTTRKWLWVSVWVCGVWHLNLRYIIHLLKKNLWRGAAMSQPERFAELKSD